MGRETPSDWEELSSEQQSALLDLADARIDGSMSRRQLLKAGGIGAAGLLGLSGSASAAPASTSDGDGDIGTPSNRVDVFADGVNANSLGTDDLSGGFTDKVLAIADGGTVTFDPSGSTPVQDAVDYVAANGRGGAGTVVLPPGLVTEATTVTMETGVDIEGWGVKRGATSGASVLRIEQSGAPGIDLNGANANGRNRLDKFVLQGQGDDAAAADAIVNSGGNVGQIYIPELEIEKWYGSAIDSDTDIFQSHFGSLYLHDIDAGDSTALVSLQQGPSISFNLIAAYPTATTSGVNSVVVDVEQSSFTGRYLNVGGSAGEVLNQAGNNIGRVCIQNINYEPGDQRTEPARLVSVEGASTFIGNINITDTGGTADVNNVYRLANDARKYDLADPNVLNTAQVLYDVVKIIQDTGGPGFYRGKVGDVNNTTGAALSEPVVCLGDVTKKVSDGTGYDGGTNDSQL